jgi:tyrosine-specific transport protein
VIICVLTFTPPFVFSVADSRAFLTALEYAGAFGVITLLGFLPALMVWGGRYEKGLSKEAKYRAPGGKLALLVVMGIAITVSLVEIIIKLG